MANATVPKEDYAKAAAALATVVELVGRFGVEGPIARTERNEPRVLLFGLALVALGAALWVMSAGSAPGSERERRGHQTGIHVYVLGLLFVIIAAVMSSHSEAANASVTVHAGVRLNAVVTSSGAVVE